MLNREAEKTRFNSLTKEQAVALAESLEGASGALRSCWNCNGAHEHLKAADRYFTCFVCGISYAGGFPTLILGMRMRGEEVTDEVMDRYEKALADAV